MLVVSLVVSIFSLFTGNGYARLVHNGSQGGFIGDEAEEIRITIIQAAGHFLNGYSGFMSLMNKIEMSDLIGLDFNEARVLIDTTIFHMENAREKYASLKQLAENAPYDPVIINKLIIFDYREFRQEFLLEDEHIVQAVFYLREGDIRGIYGKTLKDIGVLLDGLCRVQSSLYSFSIPEMSVLWNLNQKCAAFLLFGQHVARIFFRVTGKQI